MTNLTEVAEALIDLRKALKNAPKSKAGFVNWSRNKKLQAIAVAKMVEAGEREDIAKHMAFEAGRPYDTNYSKSKAA